MDRTFKVFLGYADDAESQIDIIKKLKLSIDEYIQKEINVIRNPIYSNCSFFDWKEDTSNSIGGQIDKINSNIVESQLCLFLFYKRIGNVTKQEIELAIKNQKHTTCLFPDKKMLNSIVENLEEDEDNEVRQNLLTYKKSLTADWNEEESNSITPTKQYNDSELFDIVFTKVKQVLKELHSLPNNSEEKETKNLYLSVPKLPLEYLPRVNDLNRMKDTLLLDENNKFAITSVSKSLGLHGMGGIGKSIFAIALAHDLDIRKHFNDGIYFITLGHNPNINELQKDLLTYLYEETTENTTAKLKRVLSNKKVLFIIDDIWNIKDLNFFDVINNESRLIITTRQQNIVTAFGAKDCPIDILSLSQSKKLLEKKVGQVPNIIDELSNNIIKKCGFLPLAINIVGSILKGKDIEWWEDVLNDLEEAKLENIEFSNVNEQHESLFKAIQLSVNYLEEKYKKRYLDLSVFSDSQKIPQVTLKMFWGEEYLKTIKLLIDSSLLFEEKDKKGKYYYLHDLQNDFIRSLEKNPKNKYKRLLEKYKEYYSNEWSSIPSDDTFFYNNYMEICENIECLDLSNIISREIFFNHKEIDYNLFTKLKKKLSLSKSDLDIFSTNYLLNNIVSLDSTVAVSCVKILGENHKSILNFVERYISSSISYNPDLLATCLQMIKKEYKRFENFAIEYIYNKENANPVLTITCLNILNDNGNVEVIKSFAENYISLYSSKSNPNLFVNCLNLLGVGNEKAINFAEYYISSYPVDTKPEVLACCLRVLGKSHPKSLQFAKEYFELSFNNINSAVGKECLKIVDFGYPPALKYVNEYIENKAVNSFSYDYCLLYLNTVQSKNKKGIL